MELLIGILVVGFVVALIYSNLMDDARARSDRTRAYYARQNAIREAEEAVKAAEEARIEQRRRTQRGLNIQAQLALLEKNTEIMLQFPLHLYRDVLENPGKYGLYLDASGILKQIDTQNNKKEI